MSNVPRCSTTQNSTAQRDVHQFHENAISMRRRAFRCGMGKRTRFVGIKCCFFRRGEIVSVISRTERIERESCTYTLSCINLVDSSVLSSFSWWDIFFCENNVKSGEIKIHARTRLLPEFWFWQVISPIRMVNVAFCTILLYQSKFNKKTTI